MAIKSRVTTAAKGFTYLGTPASTGYVDGDSAYDSANDNATRILDFGVWKLLFGSSGGKYGYSVNGHTGGVYLSIIDRVVFPFDSGTASVVGSLTLSKSYCYTFNSSLHGFIAGGYRGGYISTIERVVFPFDSGTATAVGALSGSRYSGGGVNSDIHGFTLGGGVVGTTYISIIDRVVFPFASGTSSVVGALSGSRYGLAGIDTTDFISQFI